MRATASTLLLQPQAEFGQLLLKALRLTLIGHLLCKWRVSLDRNAHLAHDASEVGGRDQRGRARVVVVVDALLLRARGRVGVRVVARVRASLELL